MTKYDHDLSDCCNYLDSPKITERKKRVEELRSFLENPDIVKHLHKNYDRGAGYIQWNHLYQAVHRSTLKESNRYLDEEEKRKTTNPAFTSLKSTSSLLLTVASKANTGKARLSCRDLVISVLEILENECLRRTLSVTYLNILNQNVLTAKRYGNEIKLPHWVDLLNFTLLLYDDFSNEKDKSSAIYSLQQISLHASKLAGFTPHCRTLLKKLPKIINDATLSKTFLLQTNVLQLALILCQQLKKEYRLLVCTFGEEILKNLIKMIESRSGDVFKKKELISTLILEIITVHHPCGAVPGMPGSMVSTSWRSWIAILSDLHTWFQDELDNLGRSAPMSGNLPFIVLAVTTAGLVMNKNNDESVASSADVTAEMSFGSPAVKRRKISSDIACIVDKVRSKKRITEAWPWFLFLDLFVTKHPELLQPDDFISILRLVSDFLGSSANKDINRSLWRCARGLVLVENQFKNSLKAEGKLLEDLWTNLWSTALRDFSRTEVNYDSDALHCFIQTLLVVNILESDRAPSLLKLYSDQDAAIRSANEVTTLKLLTSLLSIQNVSVKLDLLQKLLKNNQKDCAYAIVCSEAIFNLLLRSKSPITFTIEARNCWDDLEIYYMIISLEIVPPFPSFHHSSSGGETSIIGDKQFCLKFVETFNNLIDNINADELMYFVILLFQIHNLTTKYQLSVENDVNIVFHKLLYKLWVHCEQEFYSFETILPTKLINDFNYFVKIIKDCPEVMKQYDLKVVAKLLFEIADSVKDSVPVQCSSQLSNVIEDCEERKSNDSNSFTVQKVIIELLVNLGYIELVNLDKTSIQSNVMQFCRHNVDIQTVDGFNISCCAIDWIVSQKSIPDHVFLNAIEFLRELCVYWNKMIDEFVHITRILRNCIQPLYNKNCQKNGDIFCKLIASCFELIFSKNYSSKIVCELALVIGTMVQVDTECRWKFSIRQGDSEQYVSYHLLEFLKSEFNEVRTCALRFVPYIFENKNISLIKEKIQSEIFIKIIDIVNDLFKVEGNLTESDVQEEAMSIVSSVLRIILCLIVNSSPLRRKALFILFSIIKEKKINDTLAQKVIRQIEYQLNLDKASIFLEQNLDYIALAWYEKYKTFKEFPYNLLCCPSRNSFYADYKTCIVPILLENSDENDLKEICDEIRSTEKRIVEECFPEALSCIFPKLDVPVGQKMLLLTQRIIGGETLSDLLSTELDKILVVLHEKLHDENHFRLLCANDFRNLKFPLRTSSHIFVSGITFTLKYLQKTSPNPSDPLLLFLCHHYPKHIHHMMSTLTSNIPEAATSEIRLLCFHQYATLLDSLAGYLADLGDMAGYIIRGAVYTLLFLSDTELVAPALCFLYRLLSLSLPPLSKYINNLLHIIVPKLVPIVSLETIEGKASLQILKLLTVDHYDNLPSVKDLDRLPDDPLFTEWDCSKPRCSLIDELEHFVKVSEHQTVDLSVREHGLDHLLKQLVSRKTELAKLYSQLKDMRGFAEDCAKSLLHKTIFSLINLTASNNSKVRDLAAKCLGEFGPRNLRTLTLKPEFNENITKLAPTLLGILIPLMVHKDVNVSEDSCQVLRALLNTEEGCKASKNLSDVELGYITPFTSEPSQRIPPYSVELCPDSLIIAMNYWCPKDENISHFQWITELVSALLSSFSQETSFFRSLIPLIQKEAKVAETILPFITLIIFVEKKKFLPIMTEKINLFFRNHSSLHKLTTNSEDNEAKSVYLNRASLQCMLSVVNFYRQKESFTIQKVENKLNIDFLMVAKAAKFCRAYFTSILYSELWANAAMSSINDNAIKQGSSSLDIISSNLPEEDGVTLQTLLWDAYKEIGVSDAVYGCGNIHLRGTKNRIKYYKQFEMWPKIIDEYALNDSGLNLNDLVEALKKSGQYDTAMKVSCDRVEYDCAWRLEDWTLDVSVDDTADYSCFLYGALKAVKMQDESSLAIFVNKARGIVLESLQHVSLEVANSLYEPLSRLQALNEVEHIFSFGNTDRINLTIINDSDKWDLLEPILTQRSVLMYPAPEVLLDAAKFLAKQPASLLLACRDLKKVMNIEKSGRLLHEAKLEETKLVWILKEHDRAKELLKTFLNKTHDIDNDLRSRALLTYGEWMAETKSDKPASIINEFFLEAAKLSKANSEQRLAAAGCLAHYADTEFQRQTKYLKSRECAEKRKNIDLSTRAHEQLKMELHKEKGGGAAVDKQRAVITHQKQATIDKDEIENVERECLMYLKLALKEYSQCLILGDGDSNDLKMFRFVKLWLDNRDLQTELDSFIHQIPSYKFLAVLPQLAVRIAPADGSHFIATLQELLVRCSEDHPHHSLPILFALANSDKDEEFLQRSVKKRKEVKSEPRVSGAKELLGILSQSKRIVETLKSLQLLTSSYISLAYYDNGKKLGDYKIPSDEPIKKLKRLPNIPCITLTLPISKDGNYSNIIGVDKFKEGFTLVGGLNAPKKVKCLCTDGICRDQLIKGKDDLRQDAVMQQVFSVMNTLLRHDENTATRKLNIRTYRVVPLSQRSGIIEWVKDTETFGSYLCGTTNKVGAHVRFRPKDVTATDCRKKMTEVANLSNEVRIKTFVEICEKFKPVFRHFFFEKYKTPALWFERKQAYTKSVATNSMIGYILGIGDRHVQNILLDQITAEIVHIDFGVAFEQGRILPTPERVPFRLSRDIVDGMGVSGVEGVFRRCCVETMNVLRKSKEPILTTLEVLLYDPLYTWTISPKKALSLQDQDSLPINGELDETNNEKTQKRNVLAERALQRLKEKLDGIEDGSYTSVEGQVNSLIRVARDTSNLALLFNGWQPYL